MEEQDRYHRAFEYSPEKSISQDNHGHEHDHCAMTTIQITTIIITYLLTSSCSVRAAKVQGLKIKDATSSAVPDQA